MVAFVGTSVAATAAAIASWVVFAAAASKGESPAIATWGATQVARQRGGCCAGIGRLSGAAVELVVIESETRSHQHATGSGSASSSN